MEQDLTPKNILALDFDETITDHHTGGYPKTKGKN